MAVDQPAEDPSNELTSGRRPTWALVLSLAWPVLIQQFLIQAVGVYDQYLAGNFEHPDPQRHVAEQAAQTTTNYLGWFISSCSVIVSVGATALTARFIGAGNRPDASRVCNQAVVIAAVFGTMLTPVVILLIPTLVRWMGLTGASAEAAEEFLFPLILLVTFQLVAQAGIACLIGAGDTRTGPMILGGVALINMPLAWGFMHGYGPSSIRGIAGIFWGTAISHVLGAVAVLVVLARGRRGLQIRAQDLRPDFGLIGRLLRVSVPAGFDTLSIGVCQLWFLSLVTQLGNIATTAHGIAIRCEGLGYNTGHAFAAAAAALVGQNLGAHQPQRASHCAWTALGIGCIAMCTMGVIMAVFAPEMFRLFCPGEHQTPVVEAGVPILRTVAFAMPSLSAIIILTGALRGAGDTRFPILLTMIGFLAIRMPLAYLLVYHPIDPLIFGSGPGLNLPLIGAWLAMFADLFARGLLFLWRFEQGRWKMIRV